ncbi:anaphase-promoting complex subunit 11 [Melampsora americana]|nr:anaphase-promoting complex subunit 11 [Melampsora americana]
MKIKIKKVNAVAHWRWNLSNGKSNEPNQVKGGGEEEEGEEEELEEELCGICRNAFEGCCPDCKIPGDDCPLIWGECSHIFHMHCLLKWISEESSKQACPMDRRPWGTFSSFFDAS